MARSMCCRSPSSPPARCARLAREVGAPVDAARFRAGFVFDNGVEHEEDGWDGRLIKVGTATLKVRTAVPRCGITGFNPASGVRDQEVMRGLVKYREKTALPDGLLPGYATPGFATYAEVVDARRGAGGGQCRIDAGCVNALQVRIHSHIQ